MRLRGLVIGAAAVCALSNANAADASSCVDIENDVDRLACYDKLFRQAPTGAAPDEEDIAEFGAESIERDTVESIEARLAGDFTGWTGKTVFALDNGQVWRQTRNYIQPYSPRKPISQPKVTITRGALGSYNMRIEGVRKTVQVKRVK